ncbi:MAG: uracil-DNA glycosylase family protein [archaeon]
MEQLDALWKELERVHASNYPDHELVPIIGNGQTHKPKCMFVFINPTVRNISSDKNWQGPRYPFLGTKHIWRIFSRAGLFDERLLARIEQSTYWSVGLAEDVLAFLRRKGFYFTNIVKWTGHDAALPDAQKIKMFLPILEKEISIVKPVHIVTFGLIPFEWLAKQKIKLAEYHVAALRTASLQQFSVTIAGHATKIIPCYFPIGRGNPRRAIDLLQLLPCARIRATRQ